MRYICVQLQFQVRFLALNLAEKREKGSGVPRLISGGKSPADASP